MSAIATVAIAIFVSWLVLLAVTRPGRLPQDTPNTRSLHQSSVPRGGGIAIWAGTLAASPLVAPPLPWLAPLLLVILVSHWDDRHGVSVALRLATQVFAALAWLGFPALGAPSLLAVLAIVWMANLYNFMDGSDGLAAAMAVIGFGAYAWAATIAGAPSAQVSLAIAAATLPFLARNFPPARIFLGDVGAVPLGFMAAVLGLDGIASGYWPWWFPPLVFLPFIADATITLARRLLTGCNVARAHRDHYYQRLVRLGLGHRGTLVLYVALMFGTALSAIAALPRNPVAGATILPLWTLGLLLLYVEIGYHWRNNQGIE
ncbi:MAG: glycosyltransferase family 4 protein [Betaproteobacteria bacterium]